MDTTNISFQGSIGDLSQEINIKEEFNPHIEENLDVKTEVEYTLEPETTREKTEPLDAETTENQFEETELLIKNELIVNIQPDDSPNAEISNIKDEGETECILPSSPNYNTIKLEIEQDQDQGQGSFDYQNYDDSMDSSEAAALSHVEACLRDDVNIKSENVYENIPKDFPQVVKDESGLTVTETHLISNKFINTTSTITSTHDGIIESQTTKTLIMEIHPMNLENPALKMGNPEEILPTSTEAYEMEGEEFQLNSITGNILSLEQEAYGLLKKKKTTPTVEIVCPKCPKVFSQNSHLKRHLKVHETIENRANGVLKGLKTRLENKKVKEEDFKIEVPVKSEKEVKEGYHCTCGKSFRRRSRMETCLRSHTEYADSNSYDCPTCEKKFKSKELLIFHRQRQHRKKFPCKFCPTDYHTQKALFKHLRIHQKVQLTEYKIIAEGNQDLQCLLCKKTCSKLSDLKSHVMEDHTEPYQCPHCTEAFAKINEFAIHIKKTHPDVGDQSVLDVLEAFSKLVKAWKCENCGKQFHKADKLALHQVEEHTPDMKNEQHFQCGDCQRVFISKCGLNSHMRMHHRTESTEEPEPEEVGVLCLECRKVCPDMSTLTSHMRLHSMDRKYPCKYCDFRFATPQKRKKHSEIHTGDMKYVCFICEYTCSSENRLKQHKMSIKHANMKEYLLTGKPLIEEEQSTSKKDKIKETLRKKEWGVKKRKKEKRDKDGDIACDICGETFSNESEMLEHKQTHPFIEFPNDDKPSRIFFK